MRRVVLLTCVALVTSAVMGCVKRQADVGAVAQEVRARSKACSDAEAAKDIERALGYWAEDAILQAPGSPQIQGREQIRGVYTKYFTGLKEFTGTASHIEVSQAGDLAFDYGVNRMVYTTAQGDVLDMGKYLSVWKKVNGNWYIAALSVTSDAPTPTPVSARQ